jgi:archaemetzincin
LEKIYKRVRCHLYARKDLPEHFYAPQMNAYDAKKLLGLVHDTYQCRAGERILGITEVDLCLVGPPSPGHLFGIADGKVGLVSSCRLQLPHQKDDSLLVERLAKEAMHELGHLLELSHCHNKSCVMCFSKTPQGIDRKRLWYCLRCREDASVRTRDDHILGWICQ